MKSRRVGTTTPYGKTRNWGLLKKAQKARVRAARKAMQQDADLMAIVLGRREAKDDQSVRP